MTNSIPMQFWQRLPQLLAVLLVAWLPITSSFNVTIVESAEMSGTSTFSVIYAAGDNATTGNGITGTTWEKSGHAKLCEVNLTDGTYQLRLNFKAPVGFTLFVANPQAAKQNVSLRVCTGVFNASFAAALPTLTYLGPQACLDAGVPAFHANGSAVRLSEDVGFNFTYDSVTHTSAATATLSSSPLRWPIVFSPNLDQGQMSTSYTTPALIKTSVTNANLSQPIFKHTIAEAGAYLPVGLGYAGKRLYIGTIIYSSTGYDGVNATITDAVAAITLAPAPPSPPAPPPAPPAPLPPSPPSSDNSYSVFGYAAAVKVAVAVLLAWAVSASVML